MAISADFTMDTVNKRIYHSSGTDVYSVNALYSWVMDEIDELGLMDDTVPMSAQTPTADTMTNSWWLDISPARESQKYLSGGAISTSGIDADTYDDGVRLLKLDSGTYVNAVAGDIGRQVGYSGGTPGDTGTLLGYDNTLRYWWVRVDDIGDTFANDTTAIDLDDGAGTGGEDDLTGASTTGEELFSNPYTLGTTASTPYAQVYIFQNGSAIAEWSDKTNWDRGHIDVLIQTTVMGTDIDSKAITVFARQQGDTYDNFTITLTSSGQDAVPLSTAVDLDNTTGDYYLLFDGESVEFTTVGQVVAGGTSGATAEMVAVTTWVSGTDGVLTLRGINGTFADDEVITGDSEGAAVVNGTIGDTYTSYDAESVAMTTLGQIVTGTAGAKRLLRAIQDDGTSGKLLLQVDSSETGTDRLAQYKDYVNNDTVTGATEGSLTLDADSTTVVSGWSDITVAFVNGTITFDASSEVAFSYGETVTWNDGGAQSGIILKNSDNGGTSGTITLGNCTSIDLDDNEITGDQSAATAMPSQGLQSAHTMTQTFQQQSAKNYDVIVQCGDLYEAGRTLANVYEYFKFVCQEDSTFSMYTVVSTTITILDGEEYIIAYTGYSPKKVSPLATFAGGKMFGAQGVWIEGMASADATNFSLIDSDGVVQDPPASATMTVSSVVTGDRISVFRTTGGDINKDMYQSHAANNTAGDSTFETDGSPALAQDTPAAGILRIEDVSENTGHRIRYASWTGAIFTLLTEVTGTVDTASSTTVLNDSGATFQTNDILAGDIVWNVTDASWAHVKSIESQTQVITTPLQGGGDNTWTMTTDTYSFHTLPVTYTASDTLYVPFIDGTATTTSIEKTFLFASNRTVIVRVRIKGIKPFETSGTITSAGLTVAAIRTTDDIVTI